LGGGYSSALLRDVSLTLGWTGVLGETRGGTGYSTYIAGDILYGDSTGGLTKLSGNTTHNPHGVLVETIAGVPSWTRELNLSWLTLSNDGYVPIDMYVSSSKLIISNTDPDNPFTIATGNKGIALQQTNDQYGTTILKIMNRDGVNGAMFEQLGTVNLIDFVFKAWFNQSNIRYEGRDEFCFNAAPEFQIGNPAQDQPTVFISDGICSVKSEFRIHSSTSSTLTTKKYVAFDVAAAAGNYKLTYPAATGSANQFLYTNGSGVLAWTGLSASDSKSNLTYSNFVYSFTATPSFTSLSLSTALSETSGGTGQSTYTLGDLLYSSASNTLSKLSGNTTTTKKFLRQTGDGSVSAAPAWDTILAADIPSSALTKVDDTNVTLILGGSPSTALLAATSLTLGWTGTLAETRGGTGLSSYTLGDILYSSASNTLSKLSGNTTTTRKFLRQTGDGSISAAPSWDTILVSDIPSSALTKVDDTNITLTLGGSPSIALLAATSLTLGWTGTLAETRGGTGNNSYALGDLLYSSDSNTLSKLSGNTTATRKFLRQTGDGSVSAAPSWDTILAADIPSSALTKIDDTNVTLTLGGSPTTALLAATSLTLGWTGTLAETRGGTGQSTYTLGDLLYSSASNTLSKLSGNTTTTRKYLRQTGDGSVSAAPSWDTILAADIPSSALTKVDDTNITLTLGGSPSIALLAATSLTLGWTGTLAETRGGTGQSSYTLGDLLYSSASNTLSKLSGNTTTTRKFLRQTGNGSVSAAPSWDTILAADIPSSALTKVDDTNVTLTLGGSPTTALLAATSLTLGWTGTLAETRGGTGQSTYTLGDLIYSSASNTLSKLSGNTTTTKKFLTQTGNSSISAAPSWNTIVGTDLTAITISGSCSYLSYSNGTFTSNYNFNQNLTTSSSPSFTSLTLTQNGQCMYLNGSSSSFIMFNQKYGAPTYVSRSVGTKIVLSAEVYTAEVDFAIGMESGAMWFSVNDSSSSFKWYAGTTNIMSLSGAGVLSGATWQGVAVGATYGGTGQSSYTLGDMLYSSASNTLSRLSGNTTTTRKFLRQTGDGSVSAAPAWDTILAADIPSSALTKVDDTNVTLTLGGTPSSSLLAAVSLTLGWTGTLAETRGGTGQSTYTLGDLLYSSASNTLSKLSGNTTTTKKFLRQTGDGSISAAPSWDTIVGTDLTAITISGSCSYLSYSNGTFTSNYNFNQNLTTSSTPSFSTLTLSGSAPNLTLNNGTSNWINFSSNGYAAPTITTTRSTGTKLVLYDSFSDGVSADYAIGIEAATLWFGVPTSSQTFKWYAGATNIQSLNGSGAFTKNIKVSNSDTWTYLERTSAGDSRLSIYDTTNGGMLIYGNGATYNIARASTTGELHATTQDLSLTMTGSSLTVTGAGYTMIESKTSATYNTYVKWTTQNYAYSMYCDGTYDALAFYRETGGILMAYFSAGALFALNVALYLYSGSIEMLHNISNLINFKTVGVANPSFTSRSVGTKIVLYDSLSGSAVDYAIGMGSSTLWNSVETTSGYFKWYGGTTLAATLTGGGLLTLVSGLVLPNADGGTAATMDHYEEYTATVDVTSNGGSGAFTGTQSFAIKLNRVGNIVTFTANELSVAASGTYTIYGTSSGTIPSRLRPAYTIQIPIRVRDNSAGKLGMVLIQTDGAVVVYFGIDGTTSNTNSGNCGHYVFSVSYCI
jgi:hypothetical protein